MPTALELNLSCPHMDREDMGSNIGKDQALCSYVTQVVKEVARVPVWAKLTPATSDIVLEAGAVFRGGADAVVSSNTFPSLPLFDPESLEFEMNVDGLVSSGGLGGPAILPLSLAKVAQMTRAYPEKSFSGIGGISEFAHALNYFLLGCGTVQVCTAAMLDHAVGPSVIRRLVAGMTRVPREERAPGLDSGSRTSAACAATASSPTRRSADPTTPTTRAATSPRKATRSRRRSSAGSGPGSVARAQVFDARREGLAPGLPDLLRELGVVLARRLDQAVEPGVVQVGPDVEVVARMEVGQAVELPPGDRVLLRLGSDGHDVERVRQHPGLPWEIGVLELLPHRGATKP